MMHEQDPTRGLSVGAARDIRGFGLGYSSAVADGDRPDSEHHARLVESANAWLVENIAEPTSIARYHAGDTSALSPLIHAEVTRLQALNNQILWASGSPQVQADLERMRRLIDTADQQTKGAGLFERVAARLARFNGVHHILDFDNTISDYQGLGTHDMFRGKFPGSDWAEPMLTSHAPDREIFNSLFAAAWQPALKRYPEIFDAAADLIPIRHGADDYFRFLMESPGARATILSGSFEPFVMRSLGRIPHAAAVPVRAVPIEGPTIASIKKGVVIEELVAKDPRTAIIYYGDGESDFAALEAQREIVMFFVLKDSKFHREVAAAGALHVPFNDFAEIQQHMAHIQNLKQDHIPARNLA